MCKREGCRHKQEEETSHIHMITTDATVLMKNNSDGEKTSENHKKKLQKYKRKIEQKINDHLMNHDQGLTTTK